MFLELLRKNLRADRARLLVWGALVALCAAPTLVMGWGLFPGLVFCGFVPAATVVWVCASLLVRERTAETAAFEACLAMSRRTRLVSRVAPAMACVSAAVAASVLVGVFLLYTQGRRHGGDVIGAVQEPLGTILWIGSPALLCVLLAGTGAALRTGNAALVTRDCLVLLVITGWAGAKLNGAFGMQVWSDLGALSPFDWVWTSVLVVPALAGLVAACRHELRGAHLDQWRRGRRVLRAWTLGAVVVAVLGLPVQVVTSQPRAAALSQLQSASFSADGSRVVLVGTQRRLKRERGKWVWLGDMAQRRWQCVGQGNTPHWWKDGDVVAVRDVSLTDAGTAGWSLRGWSRPGPSPLPLAEITRRQLDAESRAEFVSAHPESGCALVRRRTQVGGAFAHGALVFLDPLQAKAQVIKGSERGGFVAWLPGGRGVLWQTATEEQTSGDLAPAIRSGHVAGEARAFTSGARECVPLWDCATGGHHLTWHRSPEDQRLAMTVEEHNGRTDGLDTSVGRFQVLLFSRDDARPSRSQWLRGSPTVCVWNRQGDALHVVAHLKPQTGLSTDDLTDAGAFLRAVRDRGDPVSAHLRKQLSTGALKSLAGQAGGTFPHSLIKQVVAELDDGDHWGLRDAAKAAGLKLCDEGRRLLAQAESGLSSEEDARLARLILQAAYPGAIAKDSMNPECLENLWVVCRVAVPSLRHEYGQPFVPRCSRAQAMTAETPRRAGERRVHRLVLSWGATVSHAVSSPDGNGLALTVCEMVAEDVSSAGAASNSWWRRPTRALYHSAHALFTVGATGGEPREIASLGIGAGEQGALPWSATARGRGLTVKALAWHPSAGILCAMSDARVLAIDPDDGTATDLLRSGKVVQ